MVWGCIVERAWAQVAEYGGEIQKGIVDGALATGRAARLHSAVRE